MINRLGVFVLGKQDGKNLEIYILIINSFDSYIGVHFIWLEKPTPAGLLYQQAIRSTKDVMMSLICFTAWVVHVGHALHYLWNKPQLQPKVAT